uniref:NAD(P)(+) transhydrogenase (Re/Si-specific) subunit beta n=2 Tax=uncultured Alistipes sp. TaxID=538949 RepID=UPI0027D951C0
SAKRAIIVPGYGMALAQAQHQVRQLADKLEANGATVKYAIHPVAGRMPGHMNVLLAEADVPYDQLYEMDSINDEFKDADVVIVIGANDVLNPAARDAEGTPIYGMPVLNVDHAERIVICNFDRKPGYAGVPNPLYDMSEKVTLMLGDAKESLAELLKDACGVSETVSREQAPTQETPSQDIGSVLKSAKRAIIVPGYGMALAQAQHQVRQLADKLEANGATVKYAIHPVAGRMPGHMNVLLAEADVPYDQLYEMDSINDEFKDADVVIVIGANDVLNPAARDAEGTPIYGMPVLNVDHAERIVICNFDHKPGYAGVPNPLYDMPEKVTLMLGDAKESLAELIRAIS